MEIGSIQTMDRWKWSRLRSPRPFYCWRVVCCVWVTRSAAVYRNSPRYSCTGRRRNGRRSDTFSPPDSPLYRPLLTFYRSRRILLLMGNRAEIPYGTLDLMVLKTLGTSSARSTGYGIARRIRAGSPKSALGLNQGTIYPASPPPPERRGWISERVALSGNNRESPLLHHARGPRSSQPPKPKLEPHVAMMARLLEHQA